MPERSTVGTYGHVMVSRQLMDRSDISFSAKAVMTVIDNCGGKATFQQLMEFSSSAKELRKALDELVEAGLLQKGAVL